MGALDDIEALKQLKARYCRLLDGKDWDGWRELFCAGLVADTTASGGTRIEGADAFVAFVRRVLGNRITVHQVHAPEIGLAPHGTARCTWAMEDVVRLVPGVTIRGYGHYHETCEKSDGRWRIKSLTLTRLRLDVVTPILTFRLPRRLHGGR